MHPLYVNALIPGTYAVLHTVHSEKFMLIIHIRITGTTARSTYPISADDN